MAAARSPAERPECLMRVPHLVLLFGNSNGRRSKRKRRLSEKKDAPNLSQMRDASALGFFLLGLLGLLCDLFGLLGGFLGGLLGRLLRLLGFLLRLLHRGRGAREQARDSGFQFSGLLGQYAFFRHDHNSSSIDEFKLDDSSRKTKRARLAPRPICSFVRTAVSAGGSRLYSSSPFFLEGVFFLRAAPRISPRLAPESEEPYCSTASFSSEISRALMESETLRVFLSRLVTSASTLSPLPKRSGR